MTHQGAACEHEVGACRVETLVNEEILLLPTEVADNLLYFRIEIVADICCSHVYGVQCAKERSLVVECLACVREEGMRGIIITCKEFNINYDDTMLKLRKNLNISESEAIEGMKKFW